MQMKVTLTADEATIERVARALFGKFCTDIGRKESWDDLLAAPETVAENGQTYRGAIRAWRSYAEVAIAAAADV